MAQIQVESQISTENANYWQSVLSKSTGLWYEQNIDILKRYPSIKQYTQYYDECVNYGLRNNRLSVTCYNLAKQLITALNESVAYPTDVNSCNELTLFRGARSSPGYKIGDLKIGGEMQDPGFMSKTLKFIRATKFVKNNECCIFLFKYPPGFKQLYLSPINEFPEEEEYLTYPGEVFTLSDILEIKYNGNLYKGYVLEYQKNMYNDPQQIVDKVDYRIDEMYPRFIQCLSNHLDLSQSECDPDLETIPTLFFPKTKRLISKCNLSVEDIEEVNVEGTGYISQLAYQSIEDSTQEQINGSLYAMFATGKSSPVYFTRNVEYLAQNETSLSGITNDGKFVPWYDVIVQFLNNNLSIIKLDNEVIDVKLERITCVDDLNKQLGFI